MESWGFQNNKLRVYHHFSLLQIRYAPEPNSEESHVLLRPGEGNDPEPSADWPANINEIDTCPLDTQGHLDSSNQGHIHPIGLRIDPAALTFQWTHLNTDLSPHDYISEEMWDNFGFTTNFGRYNSAQTGLPERIVQYQPCRITTTSGDQQRHRIFLTQGHYRLRTCESMPNPSLFSEIPEHPGFNFSDALRVSSHIPDGMACFSAPHGAQRLRRLSINGNSNTALGSLRPFLNWVIQPGGLSSRGVDEWNLFGDYHWDAVDSDLNALVMAQGLVSLLQVQLHGESQLTFSGVTQFISHTIQAILIPVGAVVSTAIGLWILLRKDGFLARRQARINAEEMNAAAQNGIPVNLDEIRIDRTEVARNLILTNPPGQEDYIRRTEIAFRQRSNHHILRLGPSGSGKSLSIDVVAHRAITGDLRVESFRNGVRYWQVSASAIRKVAGSLKDREWVVWETLIAEAGTQPTILSLIESDQFIGLGAPDPRLMANQSAGRDRARDVFGALLRVMEGKDRRTLADGRVTDTANIYVALDSTAGETIMNYASDLERRLTIVESRPPPPSVVREATEIVLRTSDLSPLLTRVHFQTPASGAPGPLDAVAYLGDVEGGAPPSCQERLLSKLLNHYDMQAEENGTNIEVTTDMVIEFISTEYNIAILEVRSRLTQRMTRVERAQEAINASFYSRYTALPQRGTSAHTTTQTQVAASEGTVAFPQTTFSPDTITNQLLEELDCLESYRGDANVRTTIRQVAEHITAAIPHLPAGITPDAQGRIPTSRLQECFEVGLEASLHDLENARGAAQIAQRRTLARMAHDFQRSPNARTSQSSTPSSFLPWREVWGTELGDNESIVRALESTEPELAQLWRDEIASGGQTFNTLGELIVRLESISPEYVARAYRALTNGSSTQAITDYPHRALYALLDQTREVMTETASGGRRAAVHQTRTLEERESIFRTSLESVEGVSLRSQNMTPEVERERMEAEAQARNARPRVRH